MNERRTYTVSQLTPEEAELEHIVKQAIKYGCAECDSCNHQKATYDPTLFIIQTKCVEYDGIGKPDEAQIRKCPSFMPYDITNTKNIIRLNKEREEAQMRKLTEETEKRHKEVFSHVRAMRVMARLSAHELKKALGK